MNARDPLQRLRHQLAFWYWATMASLLIVLALFFGYSYDRHATDEIDHLLSATVRGATHEADEHGYSIFPAVQQTTGGLLLYTLDEQGQAATALPAGLPDRSALSGAIAPQGAFHTLQWNNQSWRTLTVPLRNGFLQAAIDTTGLENRENHILWRIVFGCAAALGVAAYGGWWLSNRATQPIDETWSRERRFFSDASHELRTPLAVLQSGLELLRRQTAEHSQARQTVEDLLEEAAQLNTLADELLTLSRLDATDTPKNLESVNWTEILETLLRTRLPLAKQKELQLTWQLTPVLVTAEPDGLRRMSDALIENALRYTPPGGHVNVALTSMQHKALFSVCDDGPGIAPEYLPHLFERFFRVEQSTRTHEAGGTGLGLSIAEAYAQRYHGKIHVKSALGKGSCFSIELPGQ
ncbi:MAG: hypothetical protein IMW91_07400 [Firmicutes bacterium]|nr:hypothetical protein [Bacillota bacterium]